MTFTEAQETEFIVLYRRPGSGDAWRVWGRHKTQAEAESHAYRFADGVAIWREVVKLPER